MNLEGIKEFVKESRLVEHAYGYENDEGNEYWTDIREKDGKLYRIAYSSGWRSLGFFSPDFGERGYLKDQYTPKEVLRVLTSDLRMDYITRDELDATSTIPSEDPKPGMKWAWLLTYSRDELESMTRVEVLEAWDESQGSYGDNVPFCVGSNQSVREYDGMARRSGYRNLCDYIRDIATKLCPDYPNVASATPCEQLWALESSLKGTDAACNDLHAVIDELCARYGIDKQVVLDIGTGLLERGRRASGRT